jgi:transglutaminase-like putative cysteine protease
MLRMARLTVVAVWIALLVSLARSHLPVASTSPAEDTPGAAAEPRSGDEWMGLYMGEQKIGYSHSRTMAVDDGYRFEDTSYMRLSVLDEVQTITALIAATTGADYALRSFTVGINSGVGRLDVEGTVDAETLRLRMRTAADTTEQTIDLSQPIYLPSAARARLRSLGLAAGQAVTLNVFDPSSLNHHPLEVRVEGRETITVDGRPVEAWKVRETFRGLATEVWLDHEGRSLREQGPMGMVAQREDPIRAVNAGWGSDAFDLMAAIAVPMRGAIQQPRQLQHLMARVGGASGARLPADQRQRVEQGILYVEREQRLAATYQLPYAGTELATELQATPFLQIDHAKVRAAAAEARGDTKDPLVAAEQLRRWVYRRLEKRPTASIPNALQVLEMGAGDCNEHAVLFAALARASGLPTRIVAGIVYADGRFLYHAWDEVWLGSGWISVDPAFDQMPADATHVKLIAGGPEVHAELAPAIGQLSLELLPSEATAATD